MRETIPRCSLISCYDLVLMFKQAYFRKIGGINFDVFPLSDYSPDRDNNSNKDREE